MKNTSVKVSVIVPIYNAENYLRECLDSLVSQTLHDIEIICINDGSTDGSLQIICDYADQDDRIILENKKNAGYGCGMNDGLDLASGEYIGILESDDIVDSHMYEELYAVAVREDLDIVKADFYRFVSDTDGCIKKKYERIAKNLGRKAYNCVIDPGCNEQIFTCLMNTWSGIYRREFIERYHIRHNETPGASFQDTGFWFQTLALARRVYFIDKAYYMNRRDNAGSSVMSKKKVYCINDEYRFIHDFLDGNPELKNRFIYIYTLKRFRNYLWNYKRIGKEYRKKYLKDISAEFREACDEGEISMGCFTVLERIRLWCIMYCPGAAYYLLLILELFGK